MSLLSSYEKHIARNTGSDVSAPHREAILEKSVITSSQSGNFYANKSSDNALQSIQTMTAFSIPPVMAIAYSFSALLRAA